MAEEKKKRSINLSNDARCLLRLRDVEARAGLGHTKIYEMMKAGQFPLPVRLAPKIVRWDSAKIDAWLERTVEQFEDKAA